MTERITIRLNEELQQLITEIKNKGLYNLSAIVRQALKDKLSVLLLLDNSSTHVLLEKEGGKDEHTNI